MLEYYTIIPEMERDIAQHELNLDLEREQELHPKVEVVQPEVIPADVSLFIDRLQPAGV